VYRFHWLLGGCLCSAPCNKSPLIHGADLTHRMEVPPEARSAPDLLRLAMCAGRRTSVIAPRLLKALVESESEDARSRARSGEDSELVQSVRADQRETGRSPRRLPPPSPTGQSFCPPARRELVKLEANAFTFGEKPFGQAFAETRDDRIKLFIAWKGPALRIRRTRVYASEAPNQTAVLCITFPISGRDLIDAVRDVGPG
jgi:hypothetical protein